MSDQTAVEMVRLLTRRRSSWRSPVRRGVVSDDARSECVRRGALTEGKLPLGGMRGKSVDKEDQPIFEPFGWHPPPVSGVDATRVGIDMEAKVDRGAEKGKEDDTGEDAGNVSAGGAPAETSSSAKGKSWRFF